MAEGIFIHQFKKCPLLNIKNIVTPLDWPKYMINFNTEEFHSVILKTVADAVTSIMSGARDVSLFETSDIGNR